MSRFEGAGGGVCLAVDRPTSHLALDIPRPRPRLSVRLVTKCVGSKQVALGSLAVVPLCILSLVSALKDGRHRQLATTQLI